MQDKSDGRRCTTFIVPAEGGHSAQVKKGDTIEVINDAGTQVVDFWALRQGTGGEYLSMDHCREVLGKVYFSPGDVLLSNCYTPLLEFLSDTSGGRHDTLIAACSEQMYVRFGRAAGHPSCCTNFLDNTRACGWPEYLVPQPWNLFMHTEVKNDGEIICSKPPFIPGGTVRLRALEDITIVLSACPDDCYPTNGGDGSARDVTVKIENVNSMSL